MGPTLAPTTLGPTPLGLTSLPPGGIPLRPMPLGPNPWESIPCPLHSPWCPPTQPRGKPTFDPPIISDQPTPPISKPIPEGPPSGANTPEANSLGHTPLPLSLGPIPQRPNPGTHPLGPFSVGPSPFYPHPGAHRIGTRLHPTGAHQPGPQPPGANHLVPANKLGSTNRGPTPLHRPMGVAHHLEPTLMWPKACLPPPGCTLP